MADQEALERQIVQKSILVIVRQLRANQYNRKVVETELIAQGIPQGKEMTMLMDAAYELIDEMVDISLEKLK